MGRPRKQRVTCSTPGCGRVERSNGLCSLCYGRAWRKAHRKTTEANPDAWQQTDMVFLAGLLEARGSFSHRDTGEGMTFGVRLDLLDRQLAERLAATLGVGNVGRVIKPSTNPSGGCPSTAGSTSGLSSWRCVRGSPQPVAGTLTSCLPRWTDTKP
jgi:hypothetical protein